MNTQKALKIILIFIGLAIIIFSGIFVIQTLKDLDNLKFSQVKNISHKKEEENLDIDTTNWKTYRNEEFGFEFKYPEGLLAQELDYKDSRTLFMLCLDEESKTFKDVCTLDLSIIKPYTKNARIDIDFGLPYYKEERIKIGEYNMMKYYGFESQRFLGIYWRKNDEIVYDFSTSNKDYKNLIIFLKTFHSF